MLEKKHISLVPLEYNYSSIHDFIVPSLAYYNFKNSEFSIVVVPKNILLSLRVLKQHTTFQYSLLTCISGVDLLKKKYRFMLSYELLSLTFNSRIRIKVLLPEYTYISSVTSVFINANWWEREILDLFGIYFENHPDLRRILTDYGFEGYPLRKDFPLFGFIEVRYNNNNKAIISESVVLSQEFRNFNYENCW